MRDLVGLVVILLAGGWGVCIRMGYTKQWKFRVREARKARKQVRRERR